MYNITTLIKSAIDCEKVIKKFQDEFKRIRDDFGEDVVALCILEDYIVDIEKKLNIIEEKTSSNRKHEAFVFFLNFLEI